MWRAGGGEGGARGKEWRAFGEWLHGPPQQQPGPWGEGGGDPPSPLAGHSITPAAAGGGGYGMVWYALRYRGWLAGRSITLPVFRAAVRGQLAVTLGCCPPGSGGGCCCALPVDLPVPPVLLGGRGAAAVLLLPRGEGSHFHRMCRGYGVSF